MGYDPSAMASKARSCAVHGRAFDLFFILIQEAETENAVCGWIRVELLHDQVVILAGFDIGCRLREWYGTRPYIGSCLAS